jgi:hypothetical protein
MLKEIFAGCVDGGLDISHAALGQLKRRLP